MGALVNSCSLLLGVAASTWMCAHFARRTQGCRVAVWLCGAGIFALIFSAISPDNDLIRRELVRPAVQSANLVRHLKAVPRRRGNVSSLAILFEGSHPLLLPRTGLFFFADQGVRLHTRFASAVLIHSPPSFLLIRS